MDVDSETQALDGARAALSGTLWSEYARKRLEILGNPVEPIMIGFFRKRPAPRFELERFSYIDILKWGEPVKAASGLEWRQPKGRARIAVNFLVPDAEGYKPQEDYLKDMRAAGSPEDSHMLREVILSSRTAYAATYTTYYYPPADLVGSRVEIYRSETLLVPDNGGFYLVRYRAQREHFNKYYALFRRFAQYLAFEKEKKR
ncbi:MAG: hypothetical protein A3J74_10790 [Elusimicrobia bacterium RIFCSPHIGHO2_02_FULL_57_9]|nr:MAG: hypothetical protein A3J74_10790 [Elusimicrobia bacterium RIFCSPHIGHO2_02_FULL_57_9]